MNDSTLPEDGEPSSAFGTAKNWYRKHEPKIRAVAGAAVTLTGMVIAAHLAAGRSTGTQEAETDDVEGGLESGQDFDHFDHDGSREPRQSPAPFVRNLPKGQKASEEKKAQYREETGEELAPGTTYVHRSEDEDPGEAAA